MTLKELSQLYYLNREIERDIKRLEALEAKSECPPSSNLTGMPCANAISDRTGALAAEIEDLKAIISAKIVQCTHERNRLERYIIGIPDSLLRQIFTLRFVNGLTWGACAKSIGGNNSEETVKKSCYRYLQKN